MVAAGLLPLMLHVQRKALTVGGEVHVPISSQWPLNTGEADSVLPNYYGLNCCDTAPSSVCIPTQWAITTKTPSSFTTYIGS